MTSAFPCIVVPLALAACACAATEVSTTAPTAERAGEVEATIALGETASLDGVDVTPLAVEEDSRCPIGVQCIQAGTVRLRVKVGRRRPAEIVVALERPFALPAAQRLTLAAVTPYPQAGTPIGADAYRFALAMSRLP
ncbi:MAG TPA: hypothetical protein VGW34_11935 [Allosphingosinicella sp.]|nr:hypothetical protein [Allosphingosinicella sp.]